MRNVLFLKNERQVDGHRLFKVQSLLPGLWQGRDSAHLLHAVVVIAVADDVNRNIPADRLGFYFLLLPDCYYHFHHLSFSVWNVERRRDLEYPVATGSDVTRKKCFLFIFPRKNGCNAHNQQANNSFDTKCWRTSAVNWKIIRCPLFRFKFKFAAKKQITSFI